MRSEACTIILRKFNSQPRQNQNSKQQKKKKKKVQKKITMK